MQKARHHSSPGQNQQPQAESTKPQNPNLKQIQKFKIPNRFGFEFTSLALGSCLLFGI
jgi:hypothetical protein